MPRTFAAAPDRIISAFTAHAVQRSYCIWTYRTGSGGGTFGRMFEKRRSGVQVELLATQSPVYIFDRTWTTGAEWSIPIPSLNAWHHLAVTYDSSSAANAPKIYLDGISQTVTTVTAATGTIVNTADPYVIGNRNNDNLRNWAGALAHFGIYDVILSPGEIRDAMRYGFTPRGLRSYMQIDGSVSQQIELDLVLSYNGGFVQSPRPSGLNPPVLRPASLYLPRRTLTH